MNKALEIAKKFINNLLVNGNNYISNGASLTLSEIEAAEKEVVEDYKGMSNKTIKILTHEHDGLIFFYTKEAINNNREIIGFYFDRLGYPQSIHGKSLYAEHIKNRNTSTVEVQTFCITKFEEAAEKEGEIEFNKIFEVFISTLPKPAAQNIIESALRGESLTIRAFRFAWDAALSQAKPAIPEGWQLVPTEPNNAMQLE